MASPLSSAPLSSAHQPFNIAEAERHLQTLQQQIQAIAKPIVRQAGGALFNTAGDIFDQHQRLISGKKIDSTEFQTLASQIGELSGQIARAQAASGATLSSAPFPNLGKSGGQGPGLGAAGGSLVGGAAPALVPQLGAPSPTIPSHSQPLSAFAPASQPFNFSSLSQPLPGAPGDPSRTHLPAGALPMPLANGASSYSSDGDIQEAFMDPSSPLVLPEGQSFRMHPHPEPALPRPEAPGQGASLATAMHAHFGASRINYSDLTNTQFLKEKLKHLKQEKEETQASIDFCESQRRGFFGETLTRIHTLGWSNGNEDLNAEIAKLKQKSLNLDQEINDIKAILQNEAKEKAERVAVLVLQQECIEKENSIKEKNITIDGTPLKLTALPYFTLHELKEGIKDTKTLEAQKTELEAHHKYLTQRLQAITLLSS